MNELSKQEEVKERVIEELKQIYDPEIPVDIYNLGLIYKVDVKSDFEVDIEMTLTAPNCPAAEVLPGQVAHRSGRVQGVRTVNVNLTFDPPWEKDMLSEEAKMILNID